MAFPRGRRESTAADAHVDASLRALARLLARQAAREMFARIVTVEEPDGSTDEGRE